MSSDFAKLRQKLIFEYLDKYPDGASHMIARMLYRDNPLMFTSREQARVLIRYYRGSTGELNRKRIATKKYLKNV